MKSGRLRLVVMAAALVLCGYAAADPTCAELNSLWSDRYHRELKVEGPIEPFQCPSKTSILALAMYDLYSADSNQGFYRTATNRYTSTRFTGKCAGGVLALTLPSGALSLCDLYFEMVPEKRASTLFHEAGHARKTDPNHVACEHGDTAGTIACDDSLTGNYDTGSGYNWEVIYLYHVKNNPQASDMTRWVSDGHLKFLLNNRFNRISAEQIKTWSR